MKKRYLSHDEWCAEVELRASKLSNGIFNFREVAIPWSDYHLHGLSIENAAMCVVVEAIREAEKLKENAAIQDGFKRFGR